MLLIFSQAPCCRDSVFPCKTSLSLVQVMFGAGFPDVLQFNSRLVPSCIVFMPVILVTLAGTEKSNNCSYRNPKSTTTCFLQHVPDLHGDQVQYDIILFEKSFDAASYHLFQTINWHIPTLTYSGKIVYCLAGLSNILKSCSYHSDFIFSLLTLAHLTIYIYKP